MRRLSRLLLVLGALAGATACSERDRPEPSQVTRSARYTLATFQVDDRGFVIPAHDVRSVITAIEEDAQRPGTTGIYAVVFIHGFLHSADPSDRTLQRFGTFLDSLAANERSGRRVFGLYVSWPATGSLSEAETPLYSTRQSTADRVALANELTGLFEQLNRAVKESDRPSSRLVFIGHSLGARILFNSTAQVLTSNLHRQRANDSTRCAGGKSCAPVSGYGDLVVLLNPAFEAARYQAFQRYRRVVWPTPPPGPLQPGDSAQYQLPLLLVIGGENDLVTQNLFPPANPSLERIKRTALTNFDEFITHELSCADEQCVCPAPAPRPASGEQIASVLARTRASARFGCAQLVPVAGDSSNTPFLVVRAARAIIDGHSGIWGSLLRGFLVEYLEAFNAAGPAAAAGRAESGAAATSTQ